jgi:hypothetical protein
MLSGTTSEEIDNELINDPNVKEGNECFYIYPQELYTLLLISKQNPKFDKPNWIVEETYKYEWLRIYTAILNQLPVDLGNVCSCPKITAGLDWQFLCMVHGGKKGNECWGIDYCVHNLETIQKLLIDRSYFCDRKNITGRIILAFPQMFKNIHRMITHTYYSHKDLFNMYEEKYVYLRDFFCFVKSLIYLIKNTSLFNKKFIEVKLFLILSIKQLYMFSFIYKLTL